MRLVFGITLLLLGIGLGSCEFDRWSDAQPARTVETSWVRTVDGWQRAGQWQPTVAPPPRLSPVVVACGQALFSVMALVAFSAESGRLPVAHRGH